MNIFGPYKKKFWYILPKKNEFFFNHRANEISKIVR